MKQAMKARETDRLSAIRMLLSEVKNAEIDSGELDQAGFEKVVTKLAKQIKETVDEFAKAGRQEDADQESIKLSVLQAYLPEQMSDAELKKIVESVKAGMAEANPGQLIGAVMAKVKGKADGKRVSDMLKN